MLKLETFLNWLIAMFAAIVLSIALQVPLMASPGIDGPRCAPRADVIGHLSERYGEGRKAYGLAANDTLVEVYASDESGSWTIIVSSPNGLTCLVASGQAFELAADATVKGDDL
ncbi:hypothetical protein [Cognatishimia sp. MH4019]|uniref:hypothetical protein n=1 Tax=Cognatishimia sp. MH4019 TaxID=2854030 RepID=UPI001CD3890C|nr:hypothetical protein [Cognatishimia sp. MH4019]